MKCPHCGNPVHPRASTCKHCGVRFVRKSDKLARRMTANARIAMASGGLLVLVSIVLALNNALFFAGATFVAGVVLMVIGKMMN